MSLGSPDVNGPDYGDALGISNMYRWGRPLTAAAAPRLELR